MDIPPRLVRWPGVLAALLLCVPQAAGDEVVEGRLLPAAVCEGRCEVVLPTARRGEKYLLVLGSLATGAGPHRVRVRTTATPEPTRLPLQSEEPDQAWLEAIQQLGERLARARRAARAPRPAAARPAPRRVFHVPVREGDLQDPGCYEAVTGELRGVGKHCQVYVDRQCADPDRLRPVIAEAIRTFDAEIHPVAERLLGRAADVDGDGRFTLLFTPWLGRMAGGKLSLGGFVRGSDFLPHLEPPLSSRCDMMYLNSSLTQGPPLRALLAHEYTHAVLFSEHVLGDYLPEAAGVDEESWLNEGLAHVMEQVHAAGWSNLDHRIRAFLEGPSRYALVIPDYYQAGVWRTPGMRGACYLFARFCVERHGEALLGRLARSGLCGVLNLEAATGEPFARLFRLWSASLYLSAVGLRCEEVTPLGLPLCGPLGGELLAGPRVEPLALDGGVCDLLLAGTSTAHLLLHSPKGERSRLSIEADTGAGLQVSLVRLPADLPRLSLEVKRGAGGRRLEITTHDGDVRLETVRFRRTRLAAPAGWLAEGARWRSEPLPAGEGGERRLIQVVGRDRGGRRVTACIDAD